MFRLDTEDSEGFEMENQILGCQVFNMKRG